MRRFATALLYAIVGYAAGAIAGYVLVQQFSPNVHDLSVEAAMTAAFWPPKPKDALRAARTTRSRATLGT